MFELTIDGRAVRAQAGQSILEVARAAGIEIPTLCHHPDLSVVGSCRLCLVEIEGVAHQAPACATAVQEAMIVRTSSAAIDKSRKFVLESLLLHHAEPMPGEAARETEFMHAVRRYGAQRPDVGPASQTKVSSDPHPLIHVDMSLCILCTRCVRVCEEIEGCFVWKVAARGVETKIVAGLGQTMLEAGCESCGACAAYCPTGALLDRAVLENIWLARKKPDKLVRTTCCYCGVGCQLDLNVRDDQIIATTTGPGDTVNGMSLCVKGRYGNDFVNHPDRLTVPRVRQYLLEGPAGPRPSDRGPWIDVDWATALDLVARKLSAVKRESGADAVGFLASAKCTNEENYLMQKFARQVIATNNIDHCARLCHSSTVAGLNMALGSGATSNSMDDVVGQAQAMFVIGSNTTEQHPVFGAMIRQAVINRQLKLVVADPRQIGLTEFATLHLRQTPGTDVALLNGLMQIMLEKGWHDQAFIDARCEGFETFRDSLVHYTPERVAKITGVPVARLHEAAELLACNRPMAVVWAMGITQHITGVFNVLCLANLQMLLGNLGVPGGGVNPLRGQNNVQGACDMGALPNVLSGYQNVTDAATREKFSQLWALGRGSANVGQYSPRPGLTVTEMVHAAGSGKLRAFYILGENPLATDPDHNHVRQCFEAAEFVTVQELFPSETALYADVLLPGVSFAEKSGTFTNTDRRVQLIRPAVRSPGQARADWEVLADLARRVMTLEGLAPRGAQAAWDYRDASQIMDEIAAVTPSYAGVHHARLERGERLQWPVLDDRHPGTPILHVGRFTRGKGLFHAVDHLPAAELPDREFPLLLTTGRVLYHWHAGEMTRRVRGLLALYPESLIEIHCDDALRLHVIEGQLVRVTTRRGEMVGRALVTSRVPPGVLFGTFHFSGAGNVNNLTHAALDPIAKIPEYKVCAARVEAISAG